jgi:hypothetical protein
MTRIASTILIQPLDNGRGQAPDAVIMDESTGAEIVIRAQNLEAAIVALTTVTGGRL